MNLGVWCGSGGKVGWDPNVGTLVESLALAEVRSMTRVRLKSIKR